MRTKLPLALVVWCLCCTLTVSQIGGGSVSDSSAEAALEDCPVMFAKKQDLKDIPKLDRPELDLSFVQADSPVPFLWSPLVQHQRHRTYTTFMHTVHKLLHGKCVRPDGLRELVVDVGASTGMFSLLAAAMGCRVLAFEPLQDAVHQILAASAANGFEKLIGVVPCAVSSKHGSILALKGFAAFNANFTTLTRSAELDEEGKPIDPQFDGEDLGTLITGVRVDPYVREKAFAVKVDCEGCEFNALTSMGNTLMRGVDYAFIEIGWEGDRTNSWRIINWFFKKNFGAFTFFENYSEEFSKENFYHGTDEHPWSYKGVNATDVRQVDMNYFNNLDGDNRVYEDFVFIPQDRMGDFTPEVGAKMVWPVPGDEITIEHGEKLQVLCEFWNYPFRVSEAMVAVLRGTDVVAMTPMSQCTGFNNASVTVVDGAHAGYADISCAVLEPETYLVQGMDTLRVDVTHDGKDVLMDNYNSFEADGEL